MPNLRSQSLTREGITLVGSDGRTYSVTRPELVARFQLETGTPAQRKTKTLTWLRGQIEAALGPEQVPAALVDVDFDTADGGLTLLHLR